MQYKTNLSTSNQQIAFPLYPYVNATSYPKVTFRADDGTGASNPVAINRPSNDCAFQANWKSHQLFDTAYGFDIDSTTTTKQGIIVKFNSDVTGTCEIAILHASVEKQTLTSMTGFGRWTLATASANNWRPQYVRGVLNSVTSGQINVYLSGTDVNRGNEPYGFFRWSWFQSATEANLPQKFPVVVGENSITIEPYNSNGGGTVVEAIYIRLVNATNRIAIPRNVFPKAPDTINLNLLTPKLLKQNSRIVWIGDSFVVGGLFLKTKDALAVRYPISGYGYNMGKSSDFASGWGPATRSVSGGTDTADTPVVGSACYKWTQLQTGSYSITFTGTSWKCIFAKSTNSASFTYAIDGGDPVAVTTAGSADFGVISGTCTNASHTIVFTKSETTSADGLSLVMFEHALSSNQIGYQICKSGQAYNELFPTASLTTWQQLMVAIGTDVIFVENQNCVFGHTVLSPNWDYSLYAQFLENALPNLLINSGSVLVYVTSWNFSATTYTWTGDAVPAIPGQRDLDQQFKSRVLLNRIPYNVCFIDALQFIGFTSVNHLMYGSGGYQTQTSGWENSPNSISNHHGSTAGYTMLGKIIASLIMETNDSSYPKNYQVSNGVDIGNGTTGTNGLVFDNKF